MPIPFIRKMPNGKIVVQQIERSPKIENQARAFIARGGRYLIQIIPDPDDPQKVKVALMATLPIPKFGVPGIEEVVHLECENDKDLPAQVDELVWLSIRNSPPPAPEGKVIQMRKPGLVV
jgi:hypothetical protein